MSMRRWRFSEDVGASSTVAWAHASVVRSGTYSNWQSWRRAVARRRYATELRRYYTHPALALYGLPIEWEGQRSVEGVGISSPGAGWYKRVLARRGNATRLGLMHRSAEGAVIAVSSFQSATSARFIELAVSDDLANKKNLDRHDGPMDHQLGAHQIGVGLSEWQETEIHVDGSPVAFRVRRTGSMWSAYSQICDVYVKIFSSGFPLDHVTIVRIRDARPYLARAYS